MHHNKHLLSTKNIKYSSKKSLEKYLMFCVGRMQICFSVCTPASNVAHEMKIFLTCRMDPIILVFYD